MTVTEPKWVCLAATNTWGKRWPCRWRMTRGPAGAARQNQSSAKLIYLSICLRAAEADGGGVIVLGVICIETIYLIFLPEISRLRRPDFTAHFYCALSLSLSCFRLHRHADNWMKNSSCVGRCCVCVCVRMWGLKPGCILWATSCLFVILCGCIDNVCLSQQTGRPYIIKLCSG